MKYKYSFLIILLSALISIYTIFNQKIYNKKNSVIYWDIISYYSYLPAAFIYDDLTLEFTKQNTAYWADKFWPAKTEINKRAIKTSMGLSYLYSPFFFLAHIYAKFTKKESNGFSLPYKLSLILSIIVYFFIGLLYLFKILKNWFRDNIIAITIAIISFGTNIFWFTAYSSSPMPHVYNFTLFAIYIYYSMKWLEKQSFILTIVLGLLLGLISLIRPTNIIIVLFLIFWGVTSKSEFRDRIILFLKVYYKVLLMIISFLIIWLPQLLYWKEVSGSWLYFSYGKEEQFFFLYPEIINGLFSYRNGWLIYTPVMIFSLYGIYLSKSKFQIGYLPIYIFTILNIYIVLSWWCWWYVGFGNRAFIDSYALLSIPLAVFIQHVLKSSKSYKILFFSIIVFFVALNQIQSYQYGKSIIHWDSMNKNAYWAGFMKFTKPDTLKYLLTSPDYDKARKGITVSKPNVYGDIETPFKISFNEIRCNCERTSNNNTYFLSDNLDYYKFYCGNFNSTEKFHSGKQSLKLTKENPYGLEFIIKNNKPNMILEISVWRSSNSGTIVASYTESKLVYLTGSSVEEKDSTGWEKIVLKVDISQSMIGKDLKIYVWNNEQKESIYFDDISIKYIPI